MRIQFGTVSEYITATWCGPNGGGEIVLTWAGRESISPLLRQTLETGFIAGASQAHTELRMEETPGQATGRAYRGRVAVMGVTDTGVTFRQVPNTTAAAVPPAPSNSSAARLQRLQRTRRTADAVVRLPGGPRWGDLASAARAVNVNRDTMAAACRNGYTVRGNRYAWASDWDATLIARPDSCEGEAAGLRPARPAQYWPAANGGTDLGPVRRGQYPILRGGEPVGVIGVCGNGTYAKVSTPRGEVDYFDMEWNAAANWAARELTDAGTASPRVVPLDDAEHGPQPRVIRQPGRTTATYDHRGRLRVGRPESTLDETA